MILYWSPCSSIDHLYIWTWMPEAERLRYERWRNLYSRRYFELHFSHNPLDLAEEGYKTEECLVAIAKCYRVQGKLHKARKLCEEILIRNPFNSQAKKLYDEMEHFVNTSICVYTVRSSWIEGIIGLGIIFVAAICCFKIMRRMGK